MRARGKYRHRAMVRFHQDGTPSRRTEMRQALKDLGWKVLPFNWGNETYVKLKVKARTESPTLPPIPVRYQAHIVRDSARTR